MVFSGISTKTGNNFVLDTEKTSDLQNTMMQWICDNGRQAQEPIQAIAQQQQRPARAYNPVGPIKDQQTINGFHKLRTYLQENKQPDATGQESVDIVINGVVYNVANFSLNGDKHTIAIKDPIGNSISTYVYDKSNGSVEFKSFYDGNNRNHRDNSIGNFVLNSVAENGITSPVVSKQNHVDQLGNRILGSEEGQKLLGRYSARDLTSKMKELKNSGITTFADKDTKMEYVGKIGGMDTNWMKLTMQGSDGQQYQFLINNNGLINCTTHTEVPDYIKGAIKDNIEKYSESAGREILRLSAFKELETDNDKSNDPKEFIEKMQSGHVKQFHFKKDQNSNNMSILENVTFEYNPPDSIKLTIKDKETTCECILNKNGIVNTNNDIRIENIRDKIDKTIRQASSAMEKNNQDIKETKDSAISEDLTKGTIKMTFKNPTSKIQYEVEIQGNKIQTIKKDALDKIDANDVNFVTGVVSKFMKQRHENAKSKTQEVDLSNPLSPGNTPKPSNRKVQRANAKSHLI